MALVTEEGVKQERQDKIRAPRVGLGSQGRGFPDQEGREKVRRRPGVEAHQLTTDSGSKFIPACWEGKPCRYLQYIASYPPSEAKCPDFHHTPRTAGCPLLIGTHSGLIGPPYLKSNFYYCFSTLGKVFLGLCLYDTLPSSQEGTLQSQQGNQCPKPIWKEIIVCAHFRSGTY